MTGGASVVGTGVYDNTAPSFPRTRTTCIGAFWVGATASSAGARSSRLCCLTKELVRRCGCMRGSGRGDCGCGVWAVAAKTAATDANEDDELTYLVSFTYRCVATVATPSPNNGPPTPSAVGCVTPSTGGCKPAASYTSSRVLVGSSGGWALASINW